MARTTLRSAMISFLEMVQRYPIGAKVDLPKREGKGGPQEIVGYEYYNGTGFPGPLFPAALR